VDCDCVVSLLAVPGFLVQVKMYIDFHVKTRYLSPCPIGDCDFYADVFRDPRYESHRIFLQWDRDMGEEVIRPLCKVPLI
jgi:hypothetical protein